MKLTEHIILKVLFVLQISSLCAQQTPYNNLDFESSSVGSYTSVNSLTGWSIHSRKALSCNTSSVWAPGSNQFSIVSTPLLNFPGSGIVSHSPLGGTKVAQLNNLSPDTNEIKLSKTFTVQPNQTILQFAMAGYWENPAHNSCDAPRSMVLIKDCSGNQILPCFNFSMQPGAPNVSFTFSTVSSGSFFNWQTRYVDLCSYTGSCVTIEVITSDCIFGGHVGTLLLDAKCIVQNNSCIQSLSISAPQVEYCPGSNLAQLTVPPGFNYYTWQAPANAPSISIAQSTLAVLSITNPVPNSVYSLNLVTPANCTISVTQTIQTSTLTINSIVSNSTCPGGSSGSAMVSVSGSASGYNYIWSSSSNTNIGNGPVVSTLAQGIYTVSVSAINAPGCGQVTATVAVFQSAGGITDLLKPYCGTVAYLNTQGGSNFQWYNGTVTIPANMGGTAPGFTVSNPGNGQQFTVKYLSSLGCNDSVRYTLLNQPQGTINVMPLNTQCLGGNNGQAAIFFTPTPLASQVNNYFQVNNLSTLIPVYNYSFNAGASHSITVNNLSANGIYSVQVFDGSCFASASYTTLTYIPPSVTVSPTAATLCPGNAVAAGCAFISSTLISQFSYSWWPNQFLVGNVNTQMGIIVMPTVSPGSSVQVVYTVIITPTTVNCPFTKTVSITAFHPISPTISPLPVVCKSSAPLQVTVNPQGGGFLSGQVPFINSQTGIITPSLTLNGINSFTYSAGISTCVANASATFFASGVQVSASASSLCAGSSITLNALGANTYTWSNGSQAASITINPTVSGNYVVTGSDTQNNCITTAVQSLTVHSLPQVIISGNVNVCQGKTAILIASGANSYTWSNGSTQSVNSITPVVSETIGVIAATDKGCISSSVIPVMVHPTPLLSTSGNTVLCYGTLSKLRAHGASTYTWSNGVVADSIYINPPTNTSYTVAGSNIHGCTGLAVVTATVLDLPNLKIDGKKDICFGETDTIVAGGALNYSWNNGVKQYSLAIIPDASQTLIVTGTGSNNCATSVEYFLKVRNKANLEVNIENTICHGDTLVVKPKGLETYTWSYGSTADSLVIRPLSSAIFMVGGKNTEGCYAEKTIRVNVLNCDSLKEWQYRFFPNPGEGIFFLETNKNLDARIYNSLGELLQKFSIAEGKHVLNFETYPKGLYIIELVWENRKSLIKALHRGQQ